MKGTAKRQEKQPDQEEIVVKKKNSTKHPDQKYVQRPFKIRTQTGLRVVKNAGHSRILLKCQHLEGEVRGSRA